MRAFALLLVFATACPGGAGGEYATSGRSSGGEVDRGETNGRMFDFVSNKPDGDDWQIRLRGSGLWVSYAREDATDPLGSINLADKEAHKLWKLIDDLDLSGRKKGKKHEDEGYVTLQLREPGADEHFDITTVYVSRETDDEDVLALATYLQDLIFKYKKERPNF